MTLSLRRAGSSVVLASSPASSASPVTWRVRLPNLGRHVVTARSEADGTYAATAREAVIDVVLPRWTRSGSSVRLAVPYFRQQYSLSCEAAVLRMAHNYHRPGRLSSDAQVQRVIGVDPRRPAVNGGCDPDRAFCGNVNGRMFQDGYGVHAGPVATAATRLSQCRPGLQLTGFGTGALARYLNEGYPISLWGAHGRVRPVRWQAWSGRLITAWSIEHTWTIVGFNGSVANPASFFIHDPKRGSRVVSAAELMAFSRPFGTAVVVRG